MSPHAYDRARLLVGAVMISFSAPLARIADTAPTVSGFYRMLFGGLILLVWIVVRRKPLWAGTRYFLLALAVAFFFALDLIVWHRSIYFVGPGLATILPNFQVFILAAVGILIFKEPLRARYALGLPLALVGLWLLVGIDWNQLPTGYRWGVWLGLATAVVYSAYTLMLRHTQSQPEALKPEATLVLVSLSCAAMLGLMVWLEGESFIIPNMETGVALIAYGLFGQVLGWVIIARALPNVDASIAGLILLLQPALSFTWDILFFGRPTSWVELGGAALALAGIYLGTTSRRRKHKRVPAGVQ